MRSRRGPLLKAQGGTAKAAGLRVWCTGLIATWGTQGDKIPDFDGSPAAIAGQLEAVAIVAGHAPGMAGALIAGIARANELWQALRRIPFLRGNPHHGLRFSRFVARSCWLRTTSTDRLRLTCSWRSMLLDSLRQSEAEDPEQPVIILPSRIPAGARLMDQATGNSR